MQQIQGPVRFGGPAVLAGLFILTLFWLLHALITGGHAAGEESEALPTIDFVRLNKAFEVDVRQRKPPKMPEKPEEPPDAPSMTVQVQAPVAADVAIGNMAVENTTSVMTSFGLSPGDGEYMPIVKIAPMYPPSAQSRGIEGWVLLEFTVTETGAVKDPVVVEAQPAGVFEEAAKRAVLKFKYKPRMNGGKATAVPHVQHLITFKIEKNK